MEAAFPPRDGRRRGAAQPPSEDAGTPGCRFSTIELSTREREALAVSQ
jgi:hypothetical protein